MAVPQSGNKKYDLFFMQYSLVTNPCIYFKETNKWLLLSVYKKPDFLTL
jgi:hypothetical protein